MNHWIHDSPEYPFVDLTPVCDSDHAWALFRETLSAYGLLFEDLRPHDIGVRSWGRTELGDVISIGLRRGLLEERGIDPDAVGAKSEAHGNGHED